MSTNLKHKRGIVTDNIHGDIELNAAEWKVVNTPTFQRLRSLKQLGMGHLVYPNATHTRFAHSIGVFRIMCRILEKLRLKPDENEELRLAALLHDIGHYPYSHLMERIEKVDLMERLVEPDENETQDIRQEVTNYPDHEILGRYILEKRTDILEAVGGLDRAQRIGNLFSRSDIADQQLSKLIHSSLDMDRLDYLLRDSRAAGVPYGEIDLNYILNNIRVSPTGAIGVDIKALAAVEHFLMARIFMYRNVYYHKTTYGIEETCRQLLRRVRDSGRFEDILAKDGEQIFRICETDDYYHFTDSYVDNVIQKALRDIDPLIVMLAQSLISRTPPVLIHEIIGMTTKSAKPTREDVFRRECKYNLRRLANKYKLELGQFLLCGPKPIKFEERGSTLSYRDIPDAQPDEKAEIIKIFDKDSPEPKPIVEIERSMIAHMADHHHFVIQRLYLVRGNLATATIQAIRDEVSQWA